MWEKHKKYKLVRLPLEKEEIRRKQTVWRKYKQKQIQIKNNTSDREKELNKRLKKQSSIFRRSLDIQ